MKLFIKILALSVLIGLFSCSPWAHKYFSKHQNEFARDCNNAFPFVDSVAVHHYSDTSHIDGGKPYIIVGEDTFNLEKFDSLIAAKDSMGKILADSVWNIKGNSTGYFTTSPHWEAIKLKCPTVPCVCNCADTSHFLSREKMLQIIISQQKDSLQLLNTKYLQEKIDKGAWKLKAIVTWLGIGIGLILWLWLKFK